MIFKNIFKKSKMTIEFTNSEESFNTLISKHFDSNIIPQNISNTFKYMFYKIRVGVFVLIKNNKLTSFVSFTNTNFVNEWYNIISQTEDEINNIVKKSIELGDVKCNEDLLISKLNEYSSSNGLLYVVKYKESTIKKAIYQVYDMVKSACFKNKFGTKYFFVNRKDNPVLTKNKTECHTDIFGLNYPLISHNYNNICNILSFSSSPYFSDILIPTPEDWSRVSVDYKKYIDTINYCWDINYTIIPEWKDKKSIGVFRGSSTGASYNESHNPRLKIHLLTYSDENKTDTNEYKYIDAGIHRWNTRVRKSEYDEKFGYIDSNKFGNLLPFLSYQEQAEFKYIIHIEGHSSAYRLSYEMSMGSCIIFVESKYKLWFQSLLKPETNYFVFVKSDLSDLFEKIDWCRNNDYQCMLMSKRCKKFFNEYLNDNKYMIEHMSNVINSC